MREEQDSIGTVPRRDKMGLEGRERSFGTCLAIFLVITLLNTILARFGVIARPIGLGSAGLYFSVAFMIAFTLRFGGWGVLAAYIGCYLGAGMP